MSDADRVEAVTPLLSHHELEVEPPPRDRPLLAPRVEVGHFRFLFDEARVGGRVADEIDIGCRRRLLGEGRVNVDVRVRRPQPFDRARRERVVEPFAHVEEGPVRQDGAQTHDAELARLERLRIDHALKDSPSVGSKRRRARSEEPLG